MGDCSAYRNGLTCANGFVQVANCRKQATACGYCGTPTGAIPYCLRDEVPVHMLDEAGRPRFCKEPPHG